MDWKRGRSKIQDFVPLLRNWMMSEIPSKKEEQKQVGGVTW